MVLTLRMDCAHLAGGRVRDGMDGGMVVCFGDNYALGGSGVRRNRKKVLDVME